MHTTTTANKRSLNGTDINNPATNGNPNAVLLVTQKLDTSGIVYNDSPVGVYYSPDRDEREIFNQNNSAIPTGAQFNVLVGQPVL